MSDTMRLKSRKNHPQPAGILEFAQALKEVNTPHDYVQNPEVIKAMNRPGNISTPKGLNVDDQDDTGFHDASYFTPIRESFLETPRIGKQRKKDYDIPFFTPSKQSTRNSIGKSVKGWQTLRK